jgi:hypothetical protein
VFGFAIGVEPSINKGYDLVEHGMPYTILWRDQLNQLIRSLEIERAIVERTSG